MGKRTLIDLFRTSVASYPDNPMIWEHRDNSYKKYTYREVEYLVHITTAGLRDLGLEIGDRVGILSEGRGDWVVSELAVLHAKGICVLLSTKINELSELKFRIAHSGCKYLIVSGLNMSKIMKIKSDLPDLEKIITLDPIALNDEDIIHMESLRERGKLYFNKHKQECEDIWHSVEEDDIATILYTSGTIADPKGVTLLHKNYYHNVEQLNGIIDIKPDWVTLLILPWDHSFAHTAGIYMALSNGTALASIKIGNTKRETMRNIPDNIKEIKPYYLLVVPALIKKFHKNILKKINEKGWLIKKLFSQGLSVGITYQGDGFRSGKIKRFFLYPLYAFYDKIIFSKIRSQFGGQLLFLVSGGACLDRYYQQFFTALGIPIYQGYGLSEAAPVISANTPSKCKMGTSGAVLPMLECKIINEDGTPVASGRKGEIAVRGDNVMSGYWENPQSTYDTIDDDGWLLTGDMGFLDDDGFLSVCGRYKSLLISDDGEKFSPEAIEESILGHSLLIDQIMLYNNQNRYTVALVVPNNEAVRTLLYNAGKCQHEMQGQDYVIDLIHKDMLFLRKDRHMRASFPEKWVPSSFALLGEPFSEENRLLNSTLKMVRSRIADFYKSRLEYVYTEEGKNVFNHKNRMIIARL
ncbi:MAG: AMP-dependent synthetase/ligase [bacterium]